MVSTRNSAGWPAASIALRISAIGERQPVEVSLCSTQTALISLFLSLRSCSSIAAGSAPMRQSVAMNSGLRPSFSAMFFHSVANWPVSTISTRSPGDERVDQRGFPGAGAGRGVDDHRIGGLEDGLDAFEAALGELGEFRTAVVDDRRVHRAQDAVGQRRRARNLQEMAADGARGILRHQQVLMRVRFLKWRGDPAATSDAGTCRHEGRMRQSVKPFGECSALRIGTCLMHGTRGWQRDGDRRWRNGCARAGTAAQGGAPGRGACSTASPAAAMPPTPRTTRSCRSAWSRRARSRRPSARSRSRARRASACCRAAAAPRSAGQTVNASLVIDCSKYLDRMLELDVAGRRCVVEPGIVLDELNRPLQAARPVVSGRYLDRLARHHRRHGRQQFLRRALAALRQHARERARRSTPCWPTARRRISVRSRPTSPTFRGSSPLEPLARDLLAHRRARGRRDRGALSEGAAPGRRLQSRRASARPQRPQSRAYPGRLRRHARLLHPDRAEAFAAARPARGRRLPFRQLPRRRWMPRSTSSSSGRSRSS